MPDDISDTGLIPKPLKQIRAFVCPTFPIGPTKGIAQNLRQPISRRTAHPRTYFVGFFCCLGRLIFLTVAVAVSLTFQSSAVFFLSFVYLPERAKGEIFFLLSDLFSGSPSPRLGDTAASMKAIVVSAPGGPEVLQLQEVEDPEFKDDEVLIKVEATALNRADILQRKGLYPPPPGSSPYLGLECSGTVVAVGKHVSRWQVGDKVCALLTGGGYAEKVAVPAGQVLPAPPGVSLKDAASFPEVSCTVWSTVFMMSRLSAGETFLVHGGSSGIGTFAIQIAKYLGAKVFITAGSEEKLAFCKDLGADVCINYKTEDFVARVKEETGGKGVDVILDIIGANYFRRNLDSLSFDGRLFVIATMGGAVTELDLRVVLSKRLTIQAAGLRYRSPENKAAIVREVESNVWPAIASGKVKPVVYKYFPLYEAAEAHRLMESSKHIGKILLVP